MGENLVTKNLFQPSSISEQIKINIRLVIYSFITTGASIALLLLHEAFLIVFFLLIWAFLCSVMRVNDMICPNCWKKLGKVYGMIPFMVFHDFDLENCKHCHFDLTLPFES